MWSKTSSIMEFLHYFQKHKKLVVAQDRDLPSTLQKYSKEQIQAVIFKLQDNGFLWIVYQENAEVMLYLTSAGKRLVHKISWVHRSNDR
ncbi:hypothetical protein LIBO111022_12280 [Listeria booriae]|uniref:Uncharacterized protein n=1 Tax=Listeria booriae TaxID=1552123 RepID=A0A099W1T0_9LIST|nr:hypothetical protein EP57_15445 [Listeria booriae]STY45948.1 Uncharacterised protein [Listeria booriae]